MNSSHFWKNLNICTITASNLFFLFFLLLRSSSALTIFSVIILLINCEIIGQTLTKLASSGSLSSPFEIIFYDYYFNKLLSLVTAFESIFLIFPDKQNFDLNYPIWISFWQIWHSVLCSRIISTLTYWNHCLYTLGLI